MSKGTFHFLTESICNLITIPSRPDDNAGLTTTQLAQIVFFTDSGTAQIGTSAAILSNGEVVPVPEPSTRAAALLAASVIGWSQRRRVLGVFSSTLRLCR